MTMLDTSIIVPLLALLAAATYSDLREHRIPNALSLGGAAVGLLAQFGLAGFPGLGAGLAGWALCLVCFLPLYVLRGMSAGDVKLMAAVGAFVGPQFGLIACATSLVAGGIAAIVILIWRTSARVGAGEPAIAHMASARSALVTARAGLTDGLKTRMPYAGAIAAGTAFVLMQPPIVMSILEKGAWA